MSFKIKGGANACAKSPLNCALISKSLTNVQGVTAQRFRVVAPPTGNICAMTSAATRYVIRAERCTWIRSSSGVERQCDGQLRLRHIQHSEIEEAEP
jgi:hypothetical protein